MKSSTKLIMFKIPIYAALFYTVMKLLRSIPETPSLFERITAGATFTFFLIGTVIVFLDWYDVVFKKKAGGRNAAESTSEAGERSKCEFIRDKKGKMYLKVDKSLYGFTEKSAKETARFFEESMNAEDYSSLKHGDTIWLINEENPKSPKCAIVDEITREGDDITGFSADFPYEDEWCKYTGDTLGNRFFINRKTAVKKAEPPIN